MALKSTYYIPNGPANLNAIFPAIDFSYVQEYYVEVVDMNNNVVATTPLNKIGCCCNSEKVRIHFLNYCGTYDAINFNKPAISHEAQSSEYQNSLPAVLSKTDTGFERFNVRSNDNKVAKNQCYKEENMEWVQELMDSPKAFEEWKGVQGQPDDYLPIRILDKKFEKLKNEKEHNYDFTLEYKMANENQTVRN